MLKNIIQLVLQINILSYVSLFEYFNSLQNTTWLKPSTCFTLRFRTPLNFTRDLTYILLKSEKLKKGQGVEMIYATFSI